MCCTFQDFRNLFARRSRRHPARRVSYGQQSESLESRVVLSAVSAAVAVDAVVADGSESVQSTQNGDDGAEHSIGVEHRAHTIEYSRGQDESGPGPMASRGAPAFQGGVTVAASDVSSHDSQAGSDGLGDVKADDVVVGSPLLMLKCASGEHYPDSVPEDSITFRFEEIKI